MKNALIVFATLLIGTSAFANTYEYKCYSFYWNGENQEGTMSLVVDGDTAKADIDEESWDKDLGGKLNPKYKSRGSLKFLKFGYELLLESALVKGGKTLRDGSLGGIARVEGEAEGGFFQYKFICKRQI